MFRIIPNDNKDLIVPVEQLYDNDYKSRLITQILKAAEKGYDISTISPFADVDRLKVAISKLDADNATELGLLSILFAINGHDISALTNEFARDNAYKIIAQWNNDINPLCYNSVNAKCTNIKRINDVATRGIRLGIDIYDYMKDGYNTGEIEQILIGREKKLNIDTYITPGIDRDRIQGLVHISEHQKKKHLLSEEEFDKICKRQYTLKTIKKITEVKECGCDIAPILEKPLDTRQAHLILTAIKDGYDVSSMINENMTTKQLNSIYMGLRSGIDPKIYADERLSEQQMDIIKTLLVINKESDKKIDVSPLLNPSLPPDLMKNYILTKTKGTLDDELQILQEMKKYEKNTELKTNEIYL